MAKHEKKKHGGRTAMVVSMVLISVVLAGGAAYAAHFLGSEAGTAFLIGLSERHAGLFPTVGPAVSASPSTDLEKTPEPSASPEPSATPVRTRTPAPSPSPTPKPTPEPEPVDLEFPYLVEVNKGSQIVTVYTIDQDGEYTVPVKYMLCSTGSDLDKFPDGLYKIKDKYRWRRMLADTPTYAQYCSRISGSFLFHSIPYSAARCDALSVKGYNELGTPASGGCIRLLASECKWIYDNVPTGSPVRIITGEENPVLWRQLKPATLPPSSKWDPTDPDEENPNPTTAPGSQIRNTPYPGVTPAPLDEEFSPDVPRVDRTLPPDNPVRTPTPTRAPSATRTPAASETPDGTVRPGTPTPTHDDGGATPAPTHTAGDATPRPTHTAGDSTPAPGTSAPSTPKPATPEPSTPKPNTPAPEPEPEPDPNPDPGEGQLPPDGDA